MIDECVVAVYRDVELAERAIRELTQAGFTADRISLVTAGLREHPELVKELELSDDSLHDAAVTAGLGGIVGALSGLAAMVLSGLGAMFFVGPIGGAIVGGLTGGFIGAMAGWGIHDEKLRHYERLVKGGNVLLIAHGQPLDLAHAHRMLEGTDVVELHTYARSDDEASPVA